MNESKNPLPENWRDRGEERIACAEKEQHTQALPRSGGGNTEPCWKWHATVRAVCQNRLDTDLSGTAPTVLSRVHQLPRVHRPVKWGATGPHGRLQQNLAQCLVDIAGTSHAAEGEQSTEPNTMQSMQPKGCLFEQKYFCATTRNLAQPYEEDT